MYSFSVGQSGQKLYVNSNTFWSCNVVGNIKLSKYSGSGNSEINIVIPKELVSVRGEVTFSYGDERCEYPTIDLYLLNDCYIETEPMFVETINGRVIKIPFYEDNEAVSVKVRSNGVWTASGSGLYINGDELLVAASNCKEITISPNIGCDDDFNVKVILEKKE